MARTVDQAVYAIRRDAFVDAATGLIREKGYEQMSIQDVLDALDASRGAFYHYFGSKEDLLEAVVDRIAESAIASVEPILDRVVGQGLDEGTFRTGSRDHVAGVLAWLLLGAGDTASRLFLERRADSITFTDVEATLDAYREAIERILGAAPGSLVFMDDATLHLWFD
jgi:AcrR family transcriptional regulator